MDFLIAIVSFLFVIGILVVTHEWGHYFFAKRFGVKVHEFAFGIPPRIWGVKRGETEWVINSLPIGGYVRLHGEDGENTEDPDSFGTKTPWQRFVILFAGSAVHLIMAVLIFSGFRQFEGKPAEHLHPVLSELNENSLLAEAGLQPGDKILTIDGEYFVERDDWDQWLQDKAGQEVKIEFLRSAEGERNWLEENAYIQLPETFQASTPQLRVQEVLPTTELPQAGDERLPDWREGDRVLAWNGEKLNTVSELADFLQENQGQRVELQVQGSNGAEREETLLWQGTDDEDDEFGGLIEVMVDSIASNSPAEDAGFRLGDRIIRVDNERITFHHSLQDLLEEREGQEVAFTVERFVDGHSQEVVLRATPRENPPAGEGALGVLLDQQITGLSTLGIGFAFEQITEELGASFSWLSAIDLVPVSSPLDALWQGVEQTWFVVVLTVDGIGGLVSGLFTSGQVSEDVAGLPRIAEFSGSIAQEQGVVGLLWLMSVLAANLAVFNLMPFPGLDGGRIIFVLIEMVRGQKLPPEREAMVHGIGIILLLILIAFVTLRDFIQIF